MLLASYDFSHLLPFEKPGQRDTVEKLVDLAAELLPQIMRQAAIAILTVLVPCTQGDIDPLADGIDDIRD